MMSDVNLKLNINYLSIEKAANDLKVPEDGKLNEKVTELMKNDGCSRLVLTATDGSSSNPYNVSGKISKEKPKGDGSMEFSEALYGGKKTSEKTPKELLTARKEDIKG
jgi:hypothetical protein